ncbi:MAG: glycosyl transferase group 1 [Planctomycetes bacterium]|nr:glycosyl transferase group 1 [Planctomycetota bacterium]
MRFLLLLPGTGHFYCGSCLRDDWLGTALRRRGHDVVIAPLYLPLVREGGEDDATVRMGGINMYLQQKSRVARWLPRPLANLLDRPGLLRWAARRGSLTDASDLGAMTVSMLRGEDGRQAKELDKLVAWAKDIDRPDVIVLSNAMLSGVARRLTDALDRPVIATLQGEAPFLDALPAPYADEAWDTLRERTRGLAALVAVSRSYGALMQARLGIDEDRVHVVHNGIDLTDFPNEPAPLADRVPRTIGFLARMCAEKGLPVLVEAFLALKASDEFLDVRLRVAGAALPEDAEILDGLKRRLADARLTDHVDWFENVERTDKLAFLQTLSVLSVPATYGESFGLYLLEAMAGGVPVVQPRCASFPEIVDATGGGLLCEPDDAASLAEGLATLLRDQKHAQGLADAGRRTVHQHFNADRMAREFEDVGTMVARNHED